MAVTTKTLIALVLARAVLAAPVLDVATDKVAYRPGAAVSLAVKVANRTEVPLAGEMQLTVAYDLARKQSVLTETVRLDPGQELSRTAVWTSPKEELWGCETLATLTGDDGTVASGRRVFVVSDDLPKAAANYAAISPWLYRSNDRDPVAYAFEKYQRLAVPILEFYCWVPSNWGHIYPKTKRWVCGQMRYPMTFEEIDRIVGHAHRRNMLVMSYARITLEGAEGYKWAKQHPDQVWYRTPDGKLPEMSQEQVQAWEKAAEDPKYSLGRRNDLKRWTAVAKLDDFETLDDGISQYIRAVNRCAFDGIRSDWHPGSYYHPIQDWGLRISSGSIVHALYYDLQGRPLAPADPDAAYLEVVRRWKRRMTNALPSLVLGYNIQAWNSVKVDNYSVSPAAKHPLAHAEMFPGAIILDEKHFVNLPGGKRSAGMHREWSRTRKFWLRGNRLLKQFGAYHYTGAMPNRAPEPFVLHSYSLAYACGARCFGVGVPHVKHPTSYERLVTFAQRYSQYLFHPSSTPMHANPDPEFGGRVVVKASRPVVWEKFGQYVTDRDHLTVVAQLWNQPVRDKMDLKHCDEPPAVEHATVTLRQPVGMPWGKAKVYALSFEWEPWQRTIMADTARPTVEIEVPAFRYWALAVLQYPLEPQPIPERKNQ